MADRVPVIWSGPFEAHVYDEAGHFRTAQIGDQIEVTPQQAKENPGWYAPIPHKPVLKAVLAVDPELVAA